MLARKLNQKPPIGANFSPPQKSARERAVERWFLRKKVPTSTIVTSDKTVPGQYFDSETNLHYNHFRYYDPQLGRYITSDPIGLDGGYNTYLYANANAIRFYDPLGLKSEEFLKCVDNYLRGYYGDWVADVLVPYFSAYSYDPRSPNFAEAMTSTAISAGTKAAAVGGAIYGGQAIQSAGIAIIPHSVSAGTSIFSAGASVEAAGVAGIGVIGVIGAASLSFGTTAEFLARRACEEEDEC